MRSWVERTAVKTARVSLLHSTLYPLLSLPSHSLLRMPFFFLLSLPSTSLIRVTR